MISDSDTVYVVVEPAPESMDTSTDLVMQHATIGPDTIAGVYSSDVNAEHYAELIGEFAYADDLEIGETYPDALIYEMQLNQPPENSP